MPKNPVPCSRTTESKRNKWQACRVARNSKPATPRRSFPPSKFPRACAARRKSIAASGHTNNPHSRIARPMLAGIHQREEFHAAQSIREFERSARKMPSNKSVPARAEKSNGEAGGRKRRDPDQIASAKRMQVTSHSSTDIIAAQFLRWICFRFVCKPHRVEAEPSTEN